MQYHSYVNRAALTAGTSLPILMQYHSCVNRVTLTTYTSLPVWRQSHSCGDSVWVQALSLPITLAVSSISGISLRTLVAVKQVEPNQNHQGGDVAQLEERRTGTPPTQVRFPRAARGFSPRDNFQCRLSYGVHTPPCAIACVNICEHVKDPLDHVRVRWIMETLKHPACTVNWVARLCRSWPSQGKATRISHGENPIGTIQL